MVSARPCVSPDRACYRCDFVFAVAWGPAAFGFALPPLATAAGRFAGLGGTGIIASGSGGGAKARRPRAERVSYGSKSGPCPSPPATTLPPPPKPETAAGTEIVSNCTKLKNIGDVVI